MVLPHACLILKPSHTTFGKHVQTHNNPKAVFKPGAQNLSKVVQLSSIRDCLIKTYILYVLTKNPDIKHLKTLPKQVFFLLG